MPKSLRLPGFLMMLLLLCGIRLSAQDIAVRVEAIRLMERANAVSRPTHRIRNHKEEITFRAYLWFAKTLADFEINDLAALPPLFCYNSYLCFDSSACASERWFVSCARVGASYSRISRYVNNSPC